MKTLFSLFLGIRQAFGRLRLFLRLELDSLIHRNTPAFQKDGEDQDSEVLEVVKELRGNAVLREDFAKEIAGVNDKIVHLPDLIKTVDELKVLAEAAQQYSGPVPAGGGEWKKAEKDGREFREITLDWSHIRRTTGHRVPTFTKAITTNDQTPGHRVGNIPPYFSLADGDPLAPFCTMMNTAGEESTKIPKISDITFREEGTYNPDRTNQGNIGSGAINTTTYTAQVIVPEPALGAVNGLREALIGLFLEAASDIQGEKGVGALMTDAKLVAPNIGVVNTGQAAALPTDAELIEVLTTMRGTPKVKYRRQGVWQMNTSLYTKLLSYARTNSPQEVRLTDELMTLWTRPVIENDHFDTGGAANDVAAVFGDLRRGFICASNEALTIREYAATNPGAITFFARLRFVHSVWDPKGLVALKTAA